MTRRRRVARRPIRRSARRSRLRRKIAAITGLVAIALVVTVAVFLVPPWLANESGAPRAAIVDQLSLTVPNPAFVEEATVMLERAGYAVDYYPGQWVTVDFYRDLPELGHELVILRAHAAQRADLTESGLVEGIGGAGLFTSEPYDRQKYVDEQRAQRLSIAVYDTSAIDAEDGEEYFGIGPEFVAYSMNGSFDDALVVLMGCEVLTDTELAQAFVDKGAGAVVGWDGTVSASHTDAATLNMLEHLLFEDLPLREAAEVAMAEVGPDPFYDSILVSYPQDR